MRRCRRPDPETLRHLKELAQGSTLLTRYRHKAFHSPQSGLALMAKGTPPCTTSAWQGAFSRLRDLPLVGAECGACPVRSLAPQGQH